MSRRCEDCGQRKDICRETGGCQLPKPGTKPVPLRAAFGCVGRCRHGECATCDEFRRAYTRFHMEAKP